jgi:hypothetical protein
MDTLLRLFLHYARVPEMPHPMLVAGTLLIYSGVLVYVACKLSTRRKP